MELKYKPDFETARKYWQAFWQNEIIDRPCAFITAPRANPDTRKEVKRLAGTDGNYEKALKQFEVFAGQTYFGGEAIPVLKHGFGPDQFSAFLGAKLTIREEEDTSWVDTYISDWDDFNPELKTGKDSVWNKLLEYTKYAAEYSEGKFLLAMIDTHSNMDCLSAIRGPSNLCLDIMDCPDKVEAALKKVRKLFKLVYDAVYDAAKMKERGCVGAISMWCGGRYSRIQCDFMAMLGPEDGNRFVFPALKEEASYLDHCILHYDGTQALVHLDSVLAAKEFEAVQWVPGAGKPPRVEWMELYKKLQKAGKKLQIACPIEDIKKFHKELRPEGVAYFAEASSIKEADEMIAWLKKNT